MMHKNANIIELFLKKISKRSFAFGHVTTLHRDWKKTSTPQIINDGINTASHFRLLTGIVEPSILIPNVPSTELKPRPLSLSLRNLSSPACSTSSLTCFILLLGDLFIHPYQKSHQWELIRTSGCPGQQQNPNLGTKRTIPLLFTDNGDCPLIPCLYAKHSRVSSLFQLHS